ncbi:DUF4328 domain-containing protein [Demequina aurantiaca]|uniref:DUF4328 domain-containing protein n=1 Tax=Demequina aurantiaca TaxID=676200 RepID=UPI000AE4D902|nr:DUF4328 domain-containing protein [Demequina aurantiaca]
MTTPTPDDPHTQRPEQQGSPAGNSGMTAPTPPPPPSVPSHVPPPGGFQAAGWEPERPQGLAITAIALTGLYTVVQLVGAFGAQDATDRTKEAIESGTTQTDVAGSLTQLLSAVIGIASFVVLALWMTRIRSNLAKRHIKAGGPPRVEWWGWFVPIANYILPFLGMKAIARRKVSLGILLGWWIAWCVVWLSSFGTYVASFSGIDFTTGEYTNPDALDAIVPLTYVATVATIVSWAFLVVIIRRVTDRHLED